MPTDPASRRGSDGSVLPPCPNCHRVDQVEEEAQTGSSMRWFICERCGHRYSAPPRPR